MNHVNICGWHSRHREHSGSEAGAHQAHSGKKRGVGGWGGAGWRDGREDRARAEVEHTGGCEGQACLVRKLQKHQSDS